MHAGNSLLYCEEGEPMRRVIVREGERTKHGYFFETGSIKMDDVDRIPIVLSFDFTKLVGWATDFRRGEDGVISMELTISPQYVKDVGDPQNWEFTFGGREVVAVNENYKHIQSVLLRYVALVPK
jgi:hypothetical protein